MYKTGALYISYTDFRYGVSSISKDTLEGLIKAVEHLESWENNENSN